MATRKPFEPKPHSHFKIKPGLTSKEAARLAPKPKKDARGFHYDAKTGKGYWI